MKNAKWPQERIATLMEFASQGLSRREIATLMDVSVKAVTTKLLAARVYLPLNAESYCVVKRSQLTPAKFPKFENVTRDEARQVSFGAPRSGEFSRDRGYSLTGNAADLCAS